MLSPITRRALVSKVRICNQLKHEKDELIVWWYGGIVKNYRAESVPKVVVFFRKLDKNGNLGTFERRNIALTFLGLLRIGSIWKDGECKSEAVMPSEQKQIDVDFTRGAWKLVSPLQAAKSGAESPINQDDYPLPFSYDKNWLIDFPFANGKNLLIPCTEIFVRYYGCSEEVPRVLATYGWEEVNKRFYMPFDQPVTPNTWSIKLKSRMYNGDVVFLAHMKYDPYTALAAKSINAQIETSFLNKEPYTFIQAGPWFEGKAQVLVSGRLINKGKTFLALRILGGSEPQEAPIQRDRENPNKNDAPAGAELGNPTGGWPSRIIKKPPEIVDLTDDQEPDHGAASVEVEEPDFVVLGEPRVVIDVRRNKATNRPGKPRDGGDLKEFSSGEPHGGGKGVGFASIHAPAIMVSEGMLRDMWKALRYVKQKQPDLIKSIEWFTFETGFSSSEEPKLIGLQPFNEEESVETDVRNWLYLNVTEETPRGILISRIIAADKTIYIAEIQRRPRTKKDSAGNVVDTEESFKGLAFVLDEQSQFELWLGKLLSDVRHVRGIVQKLVAHCPGKAAAFKHSTAKGDGVPCETAVLNALKKVGVEAD
ncbi:MAG: hypothetical protein HY306_05710 [Nitrosomonadales bacterium]|nr:hypothetical protein [Nitrosomonadales bacterium]